MAAVVLPSGRIIATGYNHYNTGKWNGSVHAEMHAIENAISTYCRKNEITVARLIKSPLAVSMLVVRDNGYNSRPCSHCIQGITTNPYLNVQKVYYSMQGTTTGLVMETKGDLLANHDAHVSAGNLELLAGDEDDVDPFKH